MAHPAPTLLIPDAARESRSALLAALGTENVPNQWMYFMEAVKTHLPFMLSVVDENGDPKGRPSKATIKHSIIGQYGFTSWKEMIEADISEGGFGWSYFTWKEWRRAWGVVQECPWLRQEHLTYSSINAVARKIKAAKKAEELFQPPANMAELTAFIETEKADRVYKKEAAAVIAATEQAAAELEIKSALAQAQAQSQEYQRGRERAVRRSLRLRTKLHQQATQSKQHMQDHGDRVAELQGQLGELRSQVAAFQAMGTRAHLLAAWRHYWTGLKADWQAWRGS